MAGARPPGHALICFGARQNPFGGQRESGAIAKRV